MGIRMTGLTSGLDTEAIVESLMSAQKAKKTKIENKLTKSEWTKDIWKDLNTKLYSFYTKELTKFKTQGNYITKKVSSSKDSVATATASNSAVAGAHTLEVHSLASSQNVTGGQIDATSNTKSLTDLGMTAGTKIKVASADGSKTAELEITESTTIADFVSTCKDAGLNANFDTKQKRLFVSSVESGAANGFSITTEGDTLEDGTSQLTKLGLDEIDPTDKTSADDVSSTKLSIRWASDAEIVLDGATLTDTSNSFVVNGLTINLTGTTLDKTTGTYDQIQLNVTNDVDNAYNMVKDFVKNYNELLDEMNEKYSAESARGYDPLTDEQKEAMSDDEVEKWEKKIKDSLLRRDSTLDGIVLSMRTSLQVTKEVNGTKYSLSSFGICTSSDYKEKGKLHIHGDADDETYGVMDDKLKKALEENPEAVMKTLAAAGQSLYDAMTKKMAKTSISSALTFYNDKKIDSDQTAYKKEIKNMEDKLKKLEDKYYKQFTAMESALTKAQSNASIFTSYYGG